MIAPNLPTSIGLIHRPHRLIELAVCSLMRGPPVARWRTLVVVGARLLFPSGTHLHRTENLLLLLLGHLTLA